MKRTARGPADAGGRRVGIYIKNDPRALARAEELASWLRLRGVRVVRKIGPTGKAKLGPAQAPADLYCTFVLGGDGTFLSAVRWIGDREIPMLRVKFGELGFLAETAEENLLEAAERVLKGDFTIARRMRLEVRIDRMLEAGLVGEVQRLLDQGYSEDLVAMKGLGYAQLARFLRGMCTQDEAVLQLRRDTRRFAKRQLTWFRADPRIQWLDVVEVGGPAGAASLIERQWRLGCE
jgi:hypothetical protein